MPTWTPEPPTPTNGEWLAMLAPPVVAILSVLFVLLLQHLGEL